MSKYDDRSVRRIRSGARRYHQQRYQRRELCRDSSNASCYNNNSEDDAFKGYEQGDGSVCYKNTPCENSQSIMIHHDQEQIPHRRIELNCTQSSCPPLKAVFPLWQEKSSLVVDARLKKSFIHNTAKLNEKIANINQNSGLARRSSTSIASEASKQKDNLQNLRTNIVGDEPFKEFHDSQKISLSHTSTNDQENILPCQEKCKTRNTSNHQHINITDPANSVDHHQIPVNKNRKLSKKQKYDKNSVRRTQTLPGRQTCDLRVSLNRNGRFSLDGMHHYEGMQTGALLEEKRKFVVDVETRDVHPMPGNMLLHNERHPYIHSHMECNMDSWPEDYIPRTQTDISSGHFPIDVETNTDFSNGVLHDRGNIWSPNVQELSMQHDLRMLLASPNISQSYSYQDLRLPLCDQRQHMSQSFGDQLESVPQFAGFKSLVKRKDGRNTANPQTGITLINQSYTNDVCHDELDQQSSSLCSEDDGYDSENDFVLMEIRRIRYGTDINNHSPKNDTENSVSVESDAHNNKARYEFPESSLGHCGQDTKQNAVSRFAKLQRSMSGSRQDKIAAPSYESLQEHMSSHLQHLYHEEAIKYYQEQTSQSFQLVNNQDRLVLQPSQVCSCVKRKKFSTEGNEDKLNKSTCNEMMDVVDGRDDHEKSGIADCSIEKRIGEKPSCDSTNQQSRVTVNSDIIELSDSDEEFVESMVVDLTKDKHCLDVSFIAGDIDLELDVKNDENVISIEIPLPKFKSFDLLGRKWIKRPQPDHIMNNLLSTFEFCVVSYNILSDHLLRAHSSRYRNLVVKKNEWILTWDYRKENLLQELLFTGADVICLQEIEEEQFEKWFKPKLFVFGYDGMFVKRHGTLPDGCATFFKTNIFRLVASQSVSYYNKVNITTLNKNNVGLIVILQPLKTSITNNSPICITNTYFASHKFSCQARILQSAMLFAEIDRMAQSKKFKDAHHSNYYIPIIVCGEFNFKPFESIYNFFVNGNSDNLPENLKSLFGNKINSPICAPNLNINRKCCFNTNDLSFSKYKSSSNSDSNNNVEKKNHIARKDNENINSNHIRSKNDVDVSEFTIEVGEFNEFTSQDTESDFNTTSSQYTTPEKKDEDRAVILQHDLKLKSAYRHYTVNKAEEVTYFGKDGSAATADYIFYASTQDQLWMSGVLELLSVSNMQEVNVLPNQYLSSDHFLLLTSFILR